MERVHTTSYLDEFRDVSDAGGGEVGYDSPFGPGSFEIAAISAGLVKQAVSDVFHRRVANAYVVSRPPGHHALPDTAMGFCLLANIPIALEALRAERGPTRVAVLDWDVHRGNGTEACYYERNDTLTISLHQENCFPTNSGAATDRGKGNGLGYNLNIPLLASGGHQSYLDAFEVLVASALRSFEPELIVIACGLDPNCFDPLARMQAHSETFRAMAQQIMALASELCEGRLVVAHEGGYSEAYVPFCGHAIIETLAGLRTDVVDPFLAFAIEQQPAADFVAFQRARLRAQVNL